MTSFDSNGRLKVFLNSSTSSAGAPLAVRASSSMGIVSDTNVNTLVFSGSYMSASSPAAGQVIITCAPEAPIMYLSGFRGSSVESERNLYMVTSSGFFVGAEDFMCSALYCVRWQDAMTHLAGNNAGAYGSADSWSLTDQGYNYASPTVGAEIAFVTSQKTAAFPYWGKWHIATMYKSGTNLGVFVDEQGIAAAAGGAATPAWHTDISFSIGFSNNGDSGGAAVYAPGLISAVALKTGSAVDSAGIIARFHRQVVLDGDIKQNTEINWDHIWSVKQNTPGASWRDSVGSFHLTRSGTLSVLTETLPRWG